MGGRASRTIVRSSPSVAVRYEHLLHLASVEPTRCLEIDEHLRELAHTEGLVTVHVAVGAVVPAAADGGLQDVCVGLGRRSIELPS